MINVKIVNVKFTFTDIQLENNSYRLDKYNRVYFGENKFSKVKWTLSNNELILND